MARTPDLVYDVASWIAEREKLTLSLNDFASLVAKQVFIIEYIVQPNDEHIITWSRLNKSSDYQLEITDARLDSDHVIVVPVDSIVAMRFNQKRYNWDKIAKVFIEE